MGTIGLIILIAIGIVFVFQLGFLLGEQRAEKKYRRKLEIIMTETRKNKVLSTSQALVAYGIDLALKAVREEIGRNG